MVIWFVGLSGSGKTAVGSLVYQHFKKQSKNWALVDGDTVRRVWGDSLGHSVADRERNAYRVSHLCHYLDSQEFHVVACVLSIFPEWQKWNRENFSQYYQVYLNAPLELVEERDSKGLYAAAKRGDVSNVVGVDIPFPEPYQSDCVVAPPEIYEKKECIAEKIITELEGYVSC